MGKCRHINKYGMACGQRTAGNQKYCAHHAQIQKWKDEGVWEDAVKKSKDKNYDPYKKLYEDE